MAAGPVSGFVSLLGQSEPVIVAATPYGIEALLAAVFRSIIAGRGSSGPVRVGIAHPDELDAYRTGLLAEACRTAGIAADDIVLVAHGDAVQAAAAAGIPIYDPHAAAIGAALVAPQRKPVAFAPPSAASNAALGAGVAATAAVGAVVGDALSSSSAAAGSAAQAVGPVGSPLTSGPAGPSGVPLQPAAGPAGTPLQPTSGPAGTPLQPTSGPAGTTLQPPTAGPAGTPIAPGPALGTTGVSLASKLATKTKVLIVAGVVLIAGGVTAAVAGVGNSGSSSATTNAVAITTVLAPSDSATTGPTTAPGSTVTGQTTAEPSAAGPSAAGAACTIGRWTFTAESALAFWNNVGAAEGATFSATSVTGDFTITVDESALWTVAFNNWTVNFSGDLPTQLIWTGADTAKGDFGDDGTFAYSDLNTNSTLSVRSDGFSISVPSQPDVLQGGGQYVCGADSLTLAFDGNPEPYLLTRQA
jgi:hypothetical protein